MTSLRRSSRVAAKNAITNTAGRPGPQRTIGPISSSFSAAPTATAAAAASGARRSHATGIVIASTTIAAATPLCGLVTNTPLTRPMAQRLRMAASAMSPQPTSRSRQAGRHSQLTRPIALTGAPLRRRLIIALGDLSVPDLK